LPMVSTPLLAFYLSLLHPPRPPLFPYTTLFRSRAGGGTGSRNRLILHKFLTGNSFARLPDVRLRFRHKDCGRDLASAARKRRRRDRKSTRLNSSHVKISYAVFCLKKKIQTEQRD